MKDILVKCSAVESVKTGHFREPDIRVELLDVCIESLVSEIGQDDLLDEMDKHSVAQWLERQGFVVTEGE